MCDANSLQAPLALLMAAAASSSAHRVGLTNTSCATSCANDAANHAANINQQLVDAETEINTSSAATAPTRAATVPSRAARAVVCAGHALFGLSDVFDKVLYIVLAWMISFFRKGEQAVDASVLLRRAFEGSFPGIQFPEFSRGTAVNRIGNRTVNPMAGVAPCIAPCVASCIADGMAAKTDQNFKPRIRQWNLQRHDGKLAMALISRGLMDAEVAKLMQVDRKAIADVRRAMKLDSAMMLHSASEVNCGKLSGKLSDELSGKRSDELSDELSDESSGKLSDQLRTRVAAYREKNTSHWEPDGEYRVLAVGDGKFCVVKRGGKDPLHLPPRPRSGLHDIRRKARAALIDQRRNRDLSALAGHLQASPRATALGNYLVACVGLMSTASCLAQDQEGEEGEEGQEGHDGGADVCGREADAGVNDAGVNAARGPGLAVPTKRKVDVADTSCKALSNKAMRAQ